MTDSYVVVFPADFARGRTGLLARNVKKVLEMRGQKYGAIRRDGPLIIIDANDPVFASSAAGLLYGIRMVAVAKRVRNGFECTRDEIASIGSKLLLGGETFHVSVEGQSRGFVPRDLEMAATSAIIEKTAKDGVHPGTAERHDKLLYTFLTASYAYVCIFTDAGRGGVPLGTHRGKTLCCIFDELSAASCLETMRQGFDVQIIACYGADSELPELTRALNRIIPRLLRRKVELVFVRAGSRTYTARLGAAVSAMRSEAARSKIRRVALPVSPVVHPAGLIERLTDEFARAGIVSFVPLGSVCADARRDATELGLSKLGGIRGMHGTDFGRVHAAILPNDPKRLTVKIGPNNVHDILDGLGR